jgi:hypothetical protein
MVEVEKYILENIENTLRLCANHFNSYSRTTCLDRDIIMCLNCTRKLLNGMEITGKERIEPLITLKK